MPRIRQVKPEFFTSENVARLPREARLLFISIWCQADDDGLVKEDYPLLWAATFLRDGDVAPHDVAEWVQAIVDVGLAQRVPVVEKSSGRREEVLWVKGFREHQVINKPTTSRWMRQDSSAPLPEDSGSATGGLPLGMGIGRGRGMGSKNVPSSPSGDFDEWYAVYPRKTGKAAARSAYERAVRKVGAATLLDGVRRYAADPNLPERQFIPHPATWLNGERWEDEPLPPRGTGKVTPLAAKRQQQMATTERIAERERRQQREVEA